LLFENLVLSEIIKFFNNYGKNWPIYFWRTKENEEIDFIIQVSREKYVAIEVKFSMNPTEIKISNAMSLDFPKLKEIIIIVPDGDERALSNECRQIPIQKLTNLLLSFE
jgi:predicted AAA+ superfamily ATPase